MASIEAGKPGESGLQEVQIRYFLGSHEHPIPPPGTTQVSPVSAFESTPVFNPGQVPASEFWPPPDGTIPATSRPKPPRLRKRRRPGRVAFVLIALAVVIGVVWAYATHRLDSVLGLNQPVAVKPTGASANCTAKPGKDSTGARVSYEPSLVLDKKPQTAWRCNGSGAGKELRFSFAPGTKLTELALINGYSRKDARTKKSVYSEYRRITEVTWILGPGTRLKQKLAPGNESVQRMSIAPTEVTTVVLRIEAATTPGNKGDKTRDAVLISEVEFRVPPGSQ